MSKINEKWKVLILAAILAVVSIAYTIVNGQTYTLKVDFMDNACSIEEVNIEIEQVNGNDIVKCVDKNFENGVLELRLKSEIEGSTFISISDTDDEYSINYYVYVHKFGIITLDHYLGNSNGGILIPISITILLLYTLWLLIRAYLRNSRENMYQYKNIAFLGLSIFLVFALVDQFFSIFRYQGLIYTIEKTIGTFSVVSVLILPIAFIVSIFVIASNAVLVKKEGLSPHNLLGLFIGFLICLATILPSILYDLLSSMPWLDFHNQSGAASNIYLLIETTIYILVSYLECVLAATIISGIRAARHIPELNKDYILILGCQIRKDGTLTPLLKGRVDRALEFYHIQKERTGKELIFVPTGGQGDDEIVSEAEAMKHYLLEKGIDEKSILMENKSKNTFENIKFSNDLINNKNAKISFSTTNYHVFRAGAIANTQNVNMEGIGSKTKTYFWINAFIREFIAALFAEKKKHIAVICGIILWVIITIILLYMSNLF